VVTRTLLDALPDPVLVVGADGRLLEIGAAARAFLGERCGRASHLRDLIEIVDPPSRPGLTDTAARALARAGQWSGTVNLIDQAGATTPHLVTATVDGSGGVVVVARDTSDAYARELAEADSHAKDEFIARLSHELRTPLNAVLGFAQLLELEPLSPELRDDVERILTGGRHMQAILDDVLDLARLRAGRGNIDKAPVNVLEIARGVVELLEPLAERRGIRRIILPAAPLLADADRRRLWQVLLNLVSNALKYGRDGGCVRVGIVPVTGARLRIEVEDDGEGIPADAMDRLFSPFDRLGAEGGGVEGSGLGLALSHALVTAMGGVLTAASRYGVGSVFAVVLDAVSYGDDDPAATVSPGRRVVHVSGDPATRALVTSALRAGLGAATVSMPRAGLALEAVRRTRPALVLLDRDLPDGPADDLLARLGADPETAGVPTVVIVPDDDPGEHLRLRRAGAAGVVAAPVDADGLVRAVRDHLEPPARGHRPVRSGPRVGPVASC
jgi:signal transduction histidine kinase/CheY-like chemotaxis protein